MGTIISGVTENIWAPLQSQGLGPQVGFYKGCIKRRVGGGESFGVDGVVRTESNHEGVPAGIELRRNLRIKEDKQVNFKNKKVKFRNHKLDKFKVVNKMCVQEAVAYKGGWVWRSTPPHRRTNF
ncbi:UNVERIFIED_CONTAM: hypothetical protein NCL1_13290 [Trichonephila clavipes]